jgi:hypothetical protein
VVNDTRSFKSETFEKACRILDNPKKGVTVEGDRREKFQKMVTVIMEMKVERDQEDVMFKEFKLYRGCMMTRQKSSLTLLCPL